MNLFFRPALAFAALFLAALSTATAAGPTNAFFPFCIDWHDAKKRTFEEQAQMLKELGYPGVGHIWLDKVEERLKTLDAAGLRLYQITMVVDLAPGKTPYDVEMQLLRRVPPAYLVDAHHWLILHGRYVCQARKPQCARCAIAAQCDYPDKTVGN